MRLLTIEGAILDKHRQSYGDALNHAIDDLLSGKDLHLRNGSGKNVIPRKAAWIEAKDFICCGRCYLMLVQRMLKQCDLLCAEPTQLAKIVNQLECFEGAVHGYVKGKKKDKQTTSQGVAYAQAKDTLLQLFDYNQFGENKILKFYDYNGQHCFGWETSDDWGAWYFIKALKAEACAYCNADGVFSLVLNYDPAKPSRTDVRVVRKRSPLDHFYGHSKYPCLGLSLYNLVPACTRCNTNMKGAKEQSLCNHIHPYVDSFDDGLRFFALFTSIATLSMSRLRDDDVMVVLRPTNADPRLVKRAMCSSDFFHLEEVYNQIYRREIMDVVRRVLMLPASYREDLKKSYPGIEETLVNRMLVGASCDRSRINSERLSKLTCDLYEQLHVADLKYMIFS